MGIIAFDIGGSAVKYALWDGENLIGKNQFKTPKSWTQMKAHFRKVIEFFSQDFFEIEGLAFSSPGSVDQKERTIKGTSAIPYLHFFPIFDELESEFGLPVSLENDANCAALAELWLGAAKDLDHALVVVIGTGIGGAVIFDRKLHRGKQLSGGEFGYMIIEEGYSYSHAATAVHMAERYCKQMNLPEETYNGQEVFALAKAGDEIAIQEVEHFYKYLTRGIMNLMYSFDPDAILIGGGVSAMPGLLDGILVTYEKMRQKYGPENLPLKMHLRHCKFRNDANLLGAIYNFLENKKQGMD